MRIAALLAACCIVASRSLGFELTPGQVVELRVELTNELRELAGGGKPAATRFARVAVALPPDFSADRKWPVMAISATAAPRRYASSVRLLGFYAAEASAAGWVLIAADPEPDVAPEDDTNALRLALLHAALASVARQWPEALHSPLAFGGFSGGAKRSGVLAAVFAREGRPPAGVFQAGINEETVAASARTLGTLDASYRRTPVFLLAGTQDEIATLRAHEDIRDALRRAGFKRLRLEKFDGPHAVDPRPLRAALAWFCETLPVPQDGSHAKPR